MRDALSKALGPATAIDASVDRILAAAFFRKHPLQAGSSANVIALSTRSARSTSLSGVNGETGGLRR